VRINCFKNLFWEGDGEGGGSEGKEEKGESDGKEDSFLLPVFSLFVSFHRRVRTEKI
jgi:hypothetical protein